MLAASSFAALNTIPMVIARQRDKYERMVKSSLRRDGTSRYKPNAGAQEKERRKRQLAKGQIK